MSTAPPAGGSQAASQDAAPARAAGEAAAGALNAGLATGRVGARQATAALASALAHSPGVVSGAGTLARELVGAAAGRAVATPARGDTRFADPARRDHPFYRRLGQAYLAAEQAVTGMVERADVGWRTKEQARVAASILTTALAPTNTLPGNPAAAAARSRSRPGARRVPAGRFPSRAGG